MPALRQRQRVAVLLALAGAVLAGAANADPGGDFHGLVALGEQALRANDAGAALRHYERAAALRHVAEAEWGMVRSWMQAGNYRRALAFAAHAAGAHPDVVEGAGLYAWLLHIGGQPALAQQTLAEARQRDPGNALLVATAERLRDPALAPDVRLLDGATRQGPHAADAVRLPSSARAAGSGILLPAGRLAFVPAEAVADAASLWLRDARGRISAAHVTRVLPELGLAELTLDTALLDPGEAIDALAVAPRDAFPGSPELAVAFAAPVDAPAVPLWPLLRTGFVGGWIDGALYRLGTDLDGADTHGGPVFDQNGRLIGVALRGPDGAPRLLATSALRVVWPRAFADAAPDAPRLSPDAVYERAMDVVVQLIVLRRDVAMR